MAVYKEDIYELSEIDKFQTIFDWKPSDKDSAFFNTGSNFASGFNLDKLTPNQEKAVANLRKWISDNKEDGEITHPNGSWRFHIDLCEGSYGWKVTVDKRGNFLALRVDPYHEYEE